MKLIELIKNLFKHHKINTNAELVRPLDIVKIPKRKEFNNDTLVDYYKNEYSSILSTMKDYDTLILEADELNNHIKMAIDLLFNISIKEDEIKEKSVEDRINYLINSEKLDLYKNDINNLQNEVIGRLLAISEIRKELFLSKKKKEAIDNVIDRLCLSLNTLYSIEVSIINNIERYKSESKYNYEPSKEEKGKEYEIIEEKIKHLNWLQQILDNDSQINIRTDVNYILEDIASVEKQLEEYTYNHKVEITDESKNEEINNILKIPFDIEHKDELLKRIEEIEIKYRVFYEYREYQEYGDIAIDESDLTNIYNLKFSTLSISQDGIVETFVNKDTDKLEIEYYQNIIFSMIQDIIMGKNEVFNEIFSKDFTNAILLIKMLFIDKNSRILTDFGMLNLLLSLNRKDGLYNFFTNFKIQYYVSDCHVFEWDEKLPLETICFILRTCNKPIFIYSDKDSNRYFFDNNYYDLYLIYCKYYKNEEDKYYLPEGITEIKEYSSPVLRPNDLAIVNKIQNDSKGKIIYFPKSLEVINSVARLFDDNIFEDTSIKDIVLNDGLKEINTYAFFTQKLKSINLPSSITEISKDAFNYHYVKNVIININKNNCELLKYKNIKNIFSSTITSYQEESIRNIKSTIDKLTIHLEDLDDDIEIDLTKLTYKVNPDKNIDYDNVFISNIIKCIREGLQHKRGEFLELEQVLKEEDRLEIRIDNKGLLTDLDVLNKKLKEYVELNKDEVQKLKSHLEDFIVYKNSYKPTIDGLQSSYKIELEPFEAKYKLYRYYNMLNINEINMFYYAKFTYLTSFDVVKPFVSENTIDEELEYYKEIIKKRFDMKKYIKRTNKFADPNDKSINEIINPIFFKLLGNASSENILKDFYLLNIFLALDHPKKLYNFLHSFNDTFVPRHYTDDKLITFDDVKPLSTTCLIYYYMNINSTLKVNLYNGEEYIITKDFLELFHLIYLYYLNSIEITPLEMNSFYYLPEGIKEINLENIANHASVDSKIIQSIQKDLYNKDVVMPSTLKVLKGDLFNHESKGNVFLNEGLEILDVVNLALTDDEIVTIPSSVKEIINSSPISISDYSFKKIVFNNFNFENRNVLIKIFDMFLENNLRFFIFSFKFVFHYDDLNEDITPSLNFLNIMSKYGDDVYKQEYRECIIEDIVNDIEKEVRTTRGQIINKLNLVK